MHYPGALIAYLHDAFGRALASLWASTVLLVCAGAVCGVAAGAWIAPPRATIIMLAALATVVAVVSLAPIDAVRSRRRAILLPAAIALMLALGLWQYDSTRMPNGPNGLPYYYDRHVTITGMVAAAPDILDRGVNLRIAVDTLQFGGVTRRMGHDIQAHLSTSATFQYGDKLTLSGLLAVPPDLPGTTPGAYRAYLESQDIYGEMSYPRVQSLGSDAGNPLLALSIAIRGWLESGIKRILPGSEAALLIGILLGAHTRTLGALKAPFVATGMIRLLAIDGIKVSLVIGTIDALAKRWLGRWWALPITLAMLGLYVLVTGATAAGLRSSLMWALVIFAPLFGRRSDARTSLAIAAALMVAVLPALSMLGLPVLSIFFSPRLLWDPGFQLSVSATAGIVLLRSRIESYLAPLPLLIRGPLAVSFAATLGSLPFPTSSGWWYSLISPVANLLIYPLVGPIMLLGLPVATAGALWRPLGQLLALAVYPFVAAIIAVVQWLASIRLASIPAGAWPAAVMVGYYLLLLLIFVRPVAALAGVPASPDALAKRRRRRRGIAGVYGIAVLALLAFGKAGYWLPSRPPYTLIIMNVNPPSAAPAIHHKTTKRVTRHAGAPLLLFTTRSGYTVVVDGGDRPSVAATALGARLPFWQTGLDMVVATDVDAAHLGGLAGLTGRYSIARELDPGAVYPSVAYAKWRAELRDAGVPEAKLRTSATYRLDGAAHLDVLLPAGLNPDEPAAPVALRLVAGATSLLLLNAAALTAAPSDLAPPRGHRDSLLLLPSVAADPSLYAPIVQASHPALVIVPTDGNNATTADLDAISAAARAVGARVRLLCANSSVTVTADERRYDVALAQSC